MSYIYIHIFLEHSVSSNIIHNSYLSFNYWTLDTVCIPFFLRVVTQFVSTPTFRVSVVFKYQTIYNYSILSPVYIISTL